MTRKLPIILSSLLLLIFASTAHAQTVTTGSAQTATNAATRLKEQAQLLQSQKKTAFKALIQTKRDELKAKLQIIKDEKRKALVERIDAKLTEVNENKTAGYIERLDRLQLFLDKISKSATGTAVLADVKTAQAAIDTAKLAVEAQAAKTYAITVTDDLTLKLNVGTAVSQFRQDLMAVYKLVVDAKQAVQKLNTDKEAIKKEATNSAKL